MKDIGEASTWMMEEMAELRIQNAELLEVCKSFIEAKGSKTFGYYSDDQMNAIEKMKQLIQKTES